MKINFTQILQFIKQLRILAWLEMFEKWFGFFVKLIWIGMFFAFGFYIYNEYHKNVFYLKDFKVPAAWAEQGYTGEVVKEAILDEIDLVAQETALQLGLKSNNRTSRSTRNKDSDNTQILSDINVEGFNLRVIVKAILSLLGKKEKNIGGYVTMTDSSQTMHVQITGQTKKDFSIGRRQPAKNLIHDAALYIMQVKQPFTLFIYYNNKKDSSALVQLHDYLANHREIIRNSDFYYIASTMSAIQYDFDKADAWADSLLQKYPDDFDSYWAKANVSYNRLLFSVLDTAEVAKYNKMYEENLKKCIIHNTSDGEEISLAYVYLRLSRYYISQKNVKLGEEYIAKSKEIQPFDGFANNILCYAYISVKNYSKAEQYIKDALMFEPNNANFWDSLAEVYALQGKDSLSVVSLKKALQAPFKIGTVSVEAYRKDPRWQKLKKRKDFQALLYK